MHLEGCAVALFGKGRREGWCTCTFWEHVAFELNSCVCVCVNGHSLVTVLQGVPEGILTGPLALNFIPDILVKELYFRGFGFGRDAVMPAAWQEHVWVESETPQDDLVQLCVWGLLGDGPLPPADQLDASVRFEALALWAMDKLSLIRVVAVLHPDDPVFVDSTRGALQQILPS